MRDVSCATCCLREVVLPTLSTNVALFFRYFEKGFCIFVVNPSEMTLRAGFSARARAEITLRISMQEMPVHCLAGFYTRFKPIPLQFNHWFLDAPLMMFIRYFYLVTKYRGICDPTPSIRTFPTGTWARAAVLSTWNPASPRPPVSRARQPEPEPAARASAEGVERPEGLLQRDGAPGSWAREAPLGSAPGPGNRHWALRGGRPANVPHTDDPSRRSAGRQA